VRGKPLQEKFACGVVVGGAQTPPDALPAALQRPLTERFSRELI
jgi:hypothetical protein